MYRQSIRHFCEAGPRPFGGVRTAFTFTEVLVVVVILGIASAIVLPQVNSHDDLSASAAARTVMADLLYAQNRAIAMQTMHYVTFDTTHQQYTLFSWLSTVLQHPVNLSNYIMTFGQSGSNNISQSVALGELQRATDHRLRRNGSSLFV